MTMQNDMQNNTQEDRHQIEDDYNFHDSSFRRHYQMNYSDGPNEYESFYAPAYRFGYELGSDNSNTEWDQMQEKAQTHWASMHQSNWQDIADAVAYGWQEQRNPYDLRVNHHALIDDYEPAFRTHFDEEMGEAGIEYEAFAPYYSHGYDMAVAPEYRTHLWTDVEPEVKAIWEKEHKENVPWEHYRSAVHHSWHQVKTGEDYEIQAAT